MLPDTKMKSSHYNPDTHNEPVLNYAPGSHERDELWKALKQLKSEVRDIPMVIGGKDVFTNNKLRIIPPHEHAHTLGHFHEGDATHVQAAIDAALSAKEKWAATSWEERAHIFLKAADLVSNKYRWEINAATMLGQSKNAHQAEIDSACELADFFRFNVKYVYDIHQVQPDSPAGIVNKLEYRPLEGFVFALTPFNFTAIAGNLPAAPAMAGNTVVWKPAYTQIYSAWVIMKIFREAGLPDGVINLIYVDGPIAGDIIFRHRDFAGLHFTGSTGVFKHLWKLIGDNINLYKTYPRIVGETGGKDFVLAHASADPDVVATALVRGAFEYQGQKCSAASRAYIPGEIWPEVKDRMLGMLKKITVGTVEDPTHFVNAVIDDKAFTRITGYIDQAKTDGVEIVAGGKYDKSKGFFIDPTVLRVDDPHYRTMHEEIFGPVLTVYVYNSGEYLQTLDLINTTSPYALTGAVISKERHPIELANQKLSQAAGNFYINDKPTGAVVNQQPFGGARGSGTNDKAGSMWNMIRWMSPRTIKENFNPPTDFPYPHMR